MKKLNLILFLTLLPISLFAFDENAIEVTMNEYWSAWTHRDMGKAATFISPEDLEKGRRTLLPIFLEAQKNKTTETQLLIDTFFGDTKEENQSLLSGEDVFVGLNQITTALMGEAFDRLSEFSIEVTSVTPDGGDDAAIIRYNMLYDGQVIGEDFERFIKQDGTWYLRYKQDPNILAKKFESFFIQ